MAAGTPVPYNHARYLLAEGDLDFGAGDIKALLVTSAYTPDNDAHDFVDDVTNELAGSGYARQTLAYSGVTRVAKGTNKTRLSSDPVEFLAAGGPLTARRMILFKDTGTPATSPLLCHVLLDSAPADVTAADGEKIRVTPHATEGWLYL
jgi:hypothetical protein